MQVIVKVLWRRGVKLPFEQVSQARWTEGILRRSNKGRLTLEKLSATPGMGVLLELYHPALVATIDDSIVLRGVELQQIDGQQAAMLQEWKVASRPPYDARGRAVAPYEVVDYVESAR